MADPSGAVAAPYLLDPLYSVAIRRLIGQATPEIVFSGAVRQRRIAPERNNHEGNYV